MGLTRAPPRASRCRFAARGKGRTSWHPVLPLLFYVGKGSHAIYSAFAWRKADHCCDVNLLAMHAPIHGALLERIEILCRASGEEGRTSSPFVASTGISSAQHHINTSIK